MKKILVIDESPLLRSYLKSKLSTFNCQVFTAISGIDGMAKMRNSAPDLVIMDYFLSRKSVKEVLKEKKNNPNIAHIPVFIVSNKIQKKNLIELAQLGIKKIFPKPVKVDSLLSAVSDVLGVPFILDTTPCIMEVHLNDDILFIEISKGLNSEKIEILNYKIEELLSLYKIKIPKVLLIMFDISLEENDRTKLEMVFTIIRDATKAPDKAIKTLTKSDFVKDFLSDHKEFGKIELAESLEKAMDGLLGINVSGFMATGKQIVKEDFLKPSKQEMESEESINLRFREEDAVHDTIESETPKRDISIAVVDDDMVIQEMVRSAFKNMGWEISVYDDGKDFTEDIDNKSFDLVFLDLMMPHMNGFRVMEYLKENNIAIPIIILSAVTQRKAVIKTMDFGVKSYMTKPLKPTDLLNKSAEILRMNF